MNLPRHIFDTLKDSQLSQDVCVRLPQEGVTTQVSDEAITVHFSQGDSCLSFELTQLDEDAFSLSFHCRHGEEEVRLDLSDTSLEADQLPATQAFFRQWMYPGFPTQDWLEGDAVLRPVMITLQRYHTQTLPAEKDAEITR